MEKYNFAQILLQHGADPNIRSKNGKTALFYATEYSWLDDAANSDGTYISLLLKYNADLNIP
jgi:ankyrin repeat protein